MLLLLALPLRRPQDGPLRRCLSLLPWLLLIACVAVPVAVWSQPPRIPAGWSEAQLAEHLEARMPDMHHVRASEGFYVCASPRTLSELHRLPQETSHRWQGVVLVRRVTDGGPEGRVIGGFVMLGDPLLIHRIEDALR